MRPSWSLNSCSLTPESIVPGTAAYPSEVKGGHKLGGGTVRVVTRTEINRSPVKSI